MYIDKRIIRIILFFSANIFPSLDLIEKRVNVFQNNMLVVCQLGTRVS